ncbi:cytochrome c biogenesis protein CcsA [Chlamydiia bacterium]|nr:cytochrome c biogenesis protein CcsA [Chlamydiia bacterium]
MKRLLFGFTLFSFLCFWLLSAHVFTKDDTNIALKILPVQHEGRLKPLDTIARSTSLMLHENQKLHHNGRRISPIDCFLHIIYKPDIAETIDLFRIDHPQVKELLNTDAKYVSYQKLNSIRDLIYDNANHASERDNSQRDTYHNAIIHLKDKVDLYEGMSSSVFLSVFIDEFNDVFPNDEDAIDGVLKLYMLTKHLNENDERLFIDQINTYTHRFEYLDYYSQFQMILSNNNNQWLSVGDALNKLETNIEPNPYLKRSLQIYQEFQRDDHQKINGLVRQQLDYLDVAIPTVMSKIRSEVMFNDLQPFYVAAIVYIIVMLCYVPYFLFVTPKIKNVIDALTWTAFLFHTLGVVWRIYIDGRPPVTNLYTSAIFVGWASMAIALMMKRFDRSSIVSLSGTIMAYSTLSVAHYLSIGGDTIEQLRAVLNSNFWLSTHVVTIALGYALALLVGTISCMYVLLVVFKRLTKADINYIERIIYAIVCATSLLVFIGTILGGIWADQSWGRFWGWDPKENGALMIMLWFTIVLHLRIGGIVKKQFVPLFVIFGNMVVAFSWFGVNMMGVGLHSYGFMESQFVGLIMFMVSQLCVILLGTFYLYKYPVVK